MNELLYTLKWSAGNLIPANDCNPDGTSEPLLLIVGKENAEAAAKHQTEMYAIDDDEVAEVIPLSEAMSSGLIAKHASGL